MKNMKTLILTDNHYACKLALELCRLYGGIDLYQSPNGCLEEVPRISVCGHVSKIISTYGLVLSIHCKQFFPSELVQGVRCVNVHPGFNPFNRGWFPQVFSIINNYPCGVTIHEIDEQLDHGPIIVQKEYKIQSWDTSGSVYNKIMEIERELVLDYFIAIRDNTYEVTVPNKEGNLNSKNDFDKLKQFDLMEQGTFGEFINRLRSLSHNDFRNAYFIDSSGNKVYMKINLEPEIHNQVQAIKSL